MHRMTAPIIALGVSTAGALWYGALMRGVWAAQALGPICHHGGPLALHCPSCYAALAMVAGGLAASAGLAARGQRQPARVPVKSRD